MPHLNAKLFVAAVYTAAVCLLLAACNSSTDSTDPATDAPVLSYSSTTVVDTVGKPVSHLATLTGGVPTSCAASPALPSGLIVNATTCAISGTPTAVAASTAYSIIASNSVGSDTAMLTLSVVAAPVVDPGTSTLGERNGIILVSGSHTWKLEGTSSPPVYGTNGKRQFDANNYVYVNGAKTGFFIDTNQYQGVLPREFSLIVNQALGAQTCATGDSISLFASYNNAGTTFTSTACSVQVDYISSFGGMSGTITSATLKAGAKTITIQNAPFRMFKHYGKTGTVPMFATDTTVRTTLVIDSGTFELPANRYFRLDSAGYSATTPGSSFGASAVLNDGTLFSNRLNVYFQSLSNLKGTYHCGETFSGGKMNVQVWLGTYGTATMHSYLYSSPGLVAGSCTVTVDTAYTNNSSRGHYTATLVYLDGAAAQNLLTLPQRTITVHGEFKH